MTLKELLEMSLLHSDFVKEEDKDKLANLLKLAYKSGFKSAKEEVLQLLKK